MNPDLFRLAESSSQNYGGDFSCSGLDSVFDEKDEIGSRFTLTEYENTDFVLEEETISREDGENIRKRVIYDSEGFLYGHTTIQRDGSRETVLVETDDRDYIEELEGADDFEEEWRKLKYGLSDPDRKVKI